MKQALKIVKDWETRPIEYKNKILEILKYGVMAPSGENCQPWRFVFKDEILSIFNDETADTSLYNLNQNGSYLAEGALIENIDLAAAFLGYSIHVALFPDHAKQNHIADISFSLGKKQEVGNLFAFIDKRCTNRKDYTTEKLDNSSKVKITESVSGFPSQVLFVDDNSSMERVGAALAVHEKVLFENKFMHKFFYKHIIWDKDKEKESGGFYIDTLEFLPHQLKAVKLFKNWKILTVLNFFLKISDKIAKENGQKYAYSGAFCALTIDAVKPEDFVVLGRAVQRVWLTATQLGLSVHPCNGTLYLKQYCDLAGEHISPVHRGLINDAFSVIGSCFNPKNSNIAFIFRFGRSGAPSAVSKRLDPIFI
jgi:nitroreductase